MASGPSVPELDEPVFHEGWEGRVLALNLAWARRALEHRHARFAASNCRPPSTCRRPTTRSGWPGSSGCWPSAASGAAAAACCAAEVPGGAGARRPVDREPPRPARFAVGDRVRTRNLNPGGHTRLPRYARGRVGVVERVHGCHVFPDGHAHGRGEDPQWLYSGAARR